MGGIDHGESRVPVRHGQRSSEDLRSERRSAHPAQHDIRHALDRVGILREIDALPEGLDTDLLGNGEHRSDGFLRQIVLARAFLKQSQLYLLDEPASELDHAGDLNLMKVLQDLKGKSTILMTTHRPSHMKLADRVVLLRGGLVVASGPPAEIVPLVLNQGNKPASNGGHQPGQVAIA